MESNYFLHIVNCTVFLLITSCAPEEDIKNPDFNSLWFSEDFSKGTIDNTILNLEGWRNIAEVGTVQWKTQIFSSNPYAEFSAFQPDPLKREPVNIGWLISPSINMDVVEGEILLFQASQSFVSSAANSLEVFIATDYNGTNLATANWQPIAANLPTTSSPYFEFIKSGEIDLSSFTGNINLAFKVKGSGTNTALDGSYQVDAIRIYTKK